MLTLLSHAKEVFRVDCRVSASVRRSKKLPFFPTITKPFATWRRALPLSGHLPSSCQCSLGQKRRQGPKTRVLRQPSTLWCRGKVSTHEKLTFALVTVTQKLKPYFQAHTVIILTDKPLRQAMSNPKTADRLALWAIELSEFDIQYRALQSKDRLTLISQQSSLTGKIRGQRNAFNGAYIQTGRPTGRLTKQVLCSFLLKERRLNVWSTSTSPSPIVKQNMKLWWQDSISPTRQWP